MDKTNDYIKGAEEQRNRDHSESHLKWIIAQHCEWQYQMWSRQNRITFEQWIKNQLINENVW